MYIPKVFEMSDRSSLEAFIAEHSFATLVSTVESAPFATHLPLILDPSRPPHGALLGHVARANPHWRAFDGAQEALAIFHGPHAYVSPTWYATTPAVPTWNYAAVHVYGTPRIVEGDAELSGLVDRLVAVYESDRPNPWPGTLPAELKAKLLIGIVGFVMEINRIEGKCKLGQNRSMADQLGVVRHLGASPDPTARALGALAQIQLVRSAASGESAGPTGE